VLPPVQGKSAHVGFGVGAQHSSVVQTLLAQVFAADLEGRAAKPWGHMKVAQLSRDGLEGFVLAFAV
jgi:hypothetical protein